MAKNDAKQDATPTSGEYFGSAVRAVTTALKTVCRGIGRFLKFFGLWPAVIYALFGLILYLVFSFSPFDESLNAKLYLGGFMATVVCAVIITGRNLIVRPVKNVVRGYKNPLWKRNAEEPQEAEPEPVSRKKGTPYKKTKRLEPARTEEADAPAPRGSYPPRSDAPYAYYNTPEAPYPPEAYRMAAQEKPKKYFSKVDPDALIHEYSDRFEVYRMVDGRPVRDKVEYKY